MQRFFIFRVPATRGINPAARFDDQRRIRISRTHDAGRSFADADTTADESDGPSVFMGKRKKTFGKLNADFNDRDAVVYGVSTDSEFVHLAWRRQHPDLKDLPFPMLSDIKRELSQAFGVLDQNEGVALRATFVVDPEGIIRFVTVNDLNVGRNPQEVLRVLDALQTDELCPCNWQKGDEFLKAA